MASLTDKRIERLAAKLEAHVTKRALARMIATRAVVAGLSHGDTPAAVEADLMADVKRYETLQALYHETEQAVRRAKQAAGEILDDLRAQGISDADHKLMAETTSVVMRGMLRPQADGEDS